MTDGKKVVLGIATALILTEVVSDVVLVVLGGMSDLQILSTLTRVSLTMLLGVGLIQGKPAFRWIAIVLLTIGALVGLSSLVLIAPRVSYVLILWQSLVLLVDVACVGLLAFSPTVRGHFAEHGEAAASPAAIESGTREFFSGASGTARKLQLPPDRHLALLGAPEGLSAWLESELPLGGGSEAVLAFVTSEHEARATAEQLTSDFLEADPVWIAYPSDSSATGLQLRRDALWNIFKTTGFDPVRQESLDDAWSLMRFQRVERDASVS